MRLINSIKIKNDQDQKIICKNIMYQKVFCKNDVPIHLDGNCKYYEGTYDVIPMCSEQIIDVEGKHMLEDICVKEIPYYEVTNDSGGKTVKIGD